jgi:hypothetical protein
MLSGNGTFRASGTFSIQGQSGAFTAVMTTSSTATLRRPPGVVTSNARPFDYGAAFERLLDKIRKRSSIK